MRHHDTLVTATLSKRAERAIGRRQGAPRPIGAPGLAVMVSAAVLLLGAHPVGAVSRALTRSPAATPQHHPGRIPTIDNAKGLSYLEYGNALLPNCTAAAAADLLETITGIAPTYAAVINMTYDLGGEYRGISIDDALAYLQEVGLDGTRVVAVQQVGDARTARMTFARLLHADVSLLGTIEAPKVLERFGLGEAQWRLDDTVSPARPGITDHAVAIVGMGPGGLEIVSWGERIKVSWSYWLDHGGPVFAVQLSGMTPASSRG